MGCRGVSVEPSAREPIQALPFTSYMTLGGRLTLTVLEVLLYTETLSDRVAVRSKKDKCVARKQCVALVK